MNGLKNCNDVKKNIQLEIISWILRNSKDSRSRLQHKIFAESQTISILNWYDYEGEQPKSVVDDDDDDDKRKPRKITLEKKKQQVQLRAKCDDDDDKKKYNELFKGVVTKIMLFFSVFFLFLFFWSLLCLLTYIHGKWYHLR